MFQHGIKWGESNMILNDCWVDSPVAGALTDYGEGLSCKNQSKLMYKMIRQKLKFS